MSKKLLCAEIGVVLRLLRDKTLIVSSISDIADSYSLKLQIILVLEQLGTGHIYEFLALTSLKHVFELNGYILHFCIFPGVEIMKNSKRSKV